MTEFVKNTEGGVNLVFRSRWCRHCCGELGGRHRGDGPQPPRPVPLCTADGGVAMFWLGCPGFEDSDGTNKSGYHLSAPRMTIDELRQWERQQRAKVKGNPECWP